MADGPEGDGTHYRRILEAMGDGVYALDADSRYVDCNEYLAELTGYDVDEMIGETPAIFHPEEDIERFERAIRELIRDDDAKVETVETTVRTADDAVVPVEVNLTLLPSADGEFAGTVGVVRDISDRKERERELERYETFVEASGDPMYALDADGRFTFSNEAHQDLLGYDEEELLGEHASMAVTDDGVERGEATIRELLGSDDRNRATFEMRIVASDGERIETENHVALLYDEDGEFRGTVGVLRDISDRKRRERELQEYETIVRTVPDEVYTMDADGYITSVAPPAGDDTSIAGYSREEMVGSHASLVMDEDDVQRAEATIRDLLTTPGKERASFEMDHVTRDGERVPHENHIAPLYDEDGEFRGTVGVLRDISDRKERERELERQNERLAEFANVVSHDLRNPLNVARAEAEMLREQCDDEHLDHLQAAHERMEAIVEDVLTLARQGEAVEDPGRTSLERVAERAWANVEAPRATLTVEADATLPADARRLQRLLENLFRNSVDHGGESVSVTVGSLGSEGGFYVADDGPGIPEDEREAVFESGYTTEADGTGFGLAIVRRIADAHGWSVELADGSDGGARFEFAERRPS